MEQGKDGPKDATSTDAGETVPSQQNEPEINWKQVMGCVSAASMSFSGGVSLSFSSSLFPALLAPDSDIPSTPEKNAWLASSGSLSAILGAIISGYLMERVGRLAAMQLAVLPFCIAWIVIATANSFTAILIARIMIGALFIMGISPATVLVAETAIKTHRGALSSIGFTFAAFGVLFGYTLGAYLPWRAFAWVAILSPLIPLLLTWIFTAESPVWLRSRGRMKAARKASQYYYKDPDFVVQEVPTRHTSPHTNGDVENSAQKERSNHPSFFQRLWMLLSSARGLKPLILLTVMFVFQNVTGVYIIMVNAVEFFQETGSALDPYISSMMIGIVKFLSSFATIFLLRHCNRRLLLIVGTLFMGTCMAASAYATSLVFAERDGGSKSFFPPWFVVACIVCFQLCANFSIQSVPWTMSAELFPQDIRGLAQTVNFVSSHLMMFATLQAYPWMLRNMGGAVGIQSFFSAVSFLAAVFTWIFFPETHRKSLTEIEEYFVHNTIFLGHKKKGSK